MIRLITLAAVLTLCAAPQVSYAEPPDANAPAEDGVITGLLDGVDVVGAVVVLDGYHYTVSGSVADLATFSAGDSVVLGYVIDHKGDREVTFFRKEERG